MYNKYASSTILKYYSKPEFLISFSNIILVINLKYSILNKYFQYISIYSDNYHLQENKFSNKYFI